MQQNDLLLTSPNGSIQVLFKLMEHSGEDGCPFYSICYKDKTVLFDSPLGFQMKDGENLASFLTITNVNYSSHDDVWNPVFGERSVIHDHYNEMAIQLQHSRDQGKRLELCFRAYDEGIAFCWSFVGHGWDAINIVREETRFRFTGDHKTWTTYTAQGEYRETVISEVKSGCERPLTVKIDEELYAALAEAKLVDYARMKFAPDPDYSYGVISDLSSEVIGTAPLTTPWRVVLIGESPGKLLENSFIILNLNDPCAVEDTSWIKPGKVIREVTLTTQGGKACIDFAALHNIQYVEFDAGWYGHEYSDASDATFVSVDPNRSDGPLDLAEVIRYGEEKGIGIILYVNRRALEKQMDDLFPLYRAWGIKGVKFGFVNVGSQYWTTWLHEGVRKAAEHRLMVDIHDEYRPTGYSRTYPNLLTQEGIRGDEEIQSNENTLTILFTRMLLGAADNTVCYFDDRVNRISSHAYQLAKSVVLYSPWQFLYWYDRPGISPNTGEAGGQKPSIVEVPELDFFDHIVTSWCETRVIHAVIGQYATVARRSGDNWFIGSMNGGLARTIKIPLDFLDSNKSYRAYVHVDDSSVPTVTKVRIDELEVAVDEVLTVDLPARGGQAIRIVPLT